MLALAKGQSCAAVGFADREHQGEHQGEQSCYIAECF